MENLEHHANRHNAALVIVAFLQADCDLYNSDDLLSLCNDLMTDWDFNWNHKILTEDSGELESDGHLAENINVSLDDIQPQVDLQWLVGGPAEEAVDYRAVAEGLKEIAAQFEYSVVARATQTLWRNISVSPSEQWKNHLAAEVNQLMRRGLVLDHIPQERVIMALTLTLMKGICIEAPKLLRSLFTTVHQFVCRAGIR